MIPPFKSSRPKCTSNLRTHTNCYVHLRFTQHVQHVAFESHNYCDLNVIRTVMLITPVLVASCLTFWRREVTPEHILELWNTTCGTTNSYWNKMKDQGKLKYSLLWITMIRLVPWSHRLRDHIKSLPFTNDVRIIAAFKKHRSLKNIPCRSRFTNFWDQVMSDALPGCPVHNTDQNT